jgi:SulP family sulfate permease
VDASLYFPNARFIEELVNESVADNPAIRHVILECIAVNTIDLSALESLSAVNKRLAEGGIMPALVRSQGAGVGSAQAIPFPAGTEREGASVALRCAREHPA